MRTYLVILGHNYITIVPHVDGGICGDWRMVTTARVDHFLSRNKLKYLYINRYGCPVYELKKG